MAHTTTHSSTDETDACVDVYSEGELRHLAADCEELRGLDIENLYIYDELRFEGPAAHVPPAPAITSDLPARRTLSLSKPRDAYAKKAESETIKITVRHSVSLKITVNKDLTDQGQPIPAEAYFHSEPSTACIALRDECIEEDATDSIEHSSLTSQQQMLLHEDVSDDFFDGAVEVEDVYPLESLDWFDEEEVDSEGGVDSGGVDDEYVAYALDPELFYEPREDDEVLLRPNEKISREDRAFQKATDLIYNSGWPLSAHALVHQIFITNGWGAARLALEREIHKGMTPDELILAAHIKVLWAENDHFWIAFNKSGSSNLSQYNLSWPLAMLVVRAFESLPQLEELERFVDTQFECWYESFHLRRAFRSFNRFLWYRMSNLYGCLPADMPFSFGNPRDLPAEEYSDLGLDDVLDFEREADLRAVGLRELEMFLQRLRASRRRQRQLWLRVDRLRFFSVNR
ncbi:hypothetical protein PS862_04557 [Pseudomonas fluorescens]|uniref:Uncharacterized protein n=1 Tax=Pseudomonas fluorescens TaxID=294 RepID=A0A5E7NCP5_PSEFL|nr:hypothetical protein [Pseudomonas fluorescens]VVP34669.1 hypothetical protein PS862_04557 [Pseudomonas fluorescens]